MHLEIHHSRSKLIRLVEGVEIEVLEKVNGVFISKIHYGPYVEFNCKE